MSEMNPIPFAKALGKPSQAAIDSAVSDWLDDHPEATTTVEDGSITKAKLDSNLQGTVDDVADLKSALNSAVNGITNGYNYTVVANGSFSASGVTTGATNRIRTNYIQFKKGDTIVIGNGTLQHACGVWKGSVSSANIQRNDDSFSSNGETIICEYDGYLVVVFRFSNNANIGISDFDGSIVNYIYDGTLKEKVDKECKNLISMNLGYLCPIKGIETGSYLTMSTSDGNAIGVNPEQTNISFYDSNKQFIDYYAFAPGVAKRTIGPLSASLSDAKYVALTNCVPRVPIMLNYGPGAYSYEEYYEPIVSLTEDVINLKNVTSIIDMHKKDRAIVDTLMRHLNDVDDPSKNTLTLLWGSDIHYEPERVSRMVKLLNAWGSDVFDIAINTGDTVAAIQSEGLTWYDNIVDESDIPILNTVGNHDAWADLSGTLASQTNVYNMVIAPVAERTSIVQPQDASSNGLCYYYKDVNGIRIIVLDCMFWDAAQLAWFSDVLDDANTSGKPVIACVHYPFSGTYRTLLASIWNTGVSNTSGAVMPIEAAEAVQTFINAGGTFICWMQGHSHADRIVDLVDYGHQLCLQVTSFTNVETLVYKSTSVTNYNYDALTVITVDTTNKMLKMYRIGANVNGSGQMYNGFTYNYDTHTLVCDW